jgi:hypothetical protein
MTTSTISFIAWAAFMVIMLIGLTIASRRGRNRAMKTEDVASVALPEIGECAERTYEQRFGRAPTDVPVMSRTSTGSSWYPPSKTRAAKSG